MLPPEKEVKLSLLQLEAGYIGVILGLSEDNGKENGNYCNGLYRV